MAALSRLQHNLAEMAVLEVNTAEILDQLSSQAAKHAEISALLRDFREISLTHEQSLQKRLDARAPGISPPDVSAEETKNEIGNHPVSAALQKASVALNEMIIGYAMLRTIALRNRDSILAGAENTGDMAEQHAKIYAGAVHKINQVLHNIVVWEMDRDGETCQCTCPSCGLGICLCAQAPRRTLSDTWAELGPISTDAAVTVQQPKPDSVAAAAGLQAGDLIISADGQELESHFSLQDIISRHQSGETIVLRIRRASGGLESVELVRP